MFRKISVVLVMVTMVIISCDRDGFQKAHNDPSQACVYELMMLKGEVKEVRQETIVESLDGEQEKSSCMFRFDKNHNYVYEGGGYVIDRGTPYGLLPEPGGEYAYWEFPYKWTEINDTSFTVYVPVEGGKVKLGYEYKWDENGLYTDVRCYIEDEPVLFEGEANLAKVLYYDNGLTRYKFDLDINGLTMTHYQYEDFDKAGNPQKIIISSESQKTTITRSYIYR